MIGNQPLPLKPDAALIQGLHVLTLTPFYPVEGDDGQGCFVAEPLLWAGKIGVASTVIAAQPFYRARMASGTVVPPARWERFFSLPGGFGLSTAGAFLFSRILPEVRRLHQANPIKVIHAHAALPCGHAAALLSRELRIPFVVTVHGLDAFSTRQVRGYAGQWCERVSRMVYRSAKWVICVSERVMDAVLSDAPAARVTVVYNGVDPEMFSLAMSSGAVSSTVLSVGNLIPTKGHEQLLRAISGLGDAPNLSCEIIGEGPERSRLIQLSHELGIAERIRFLGRQSRLQVAEAMARCTVFALPSSYEGLGCVYLEAMSSEKPIIGCLGQGIAEVIQNGINGWLVEPGDAPSVTEALAHLLQDAQLRERMGKAARSTVLQGFTLEHQAERLFELYAETAA